ncbi:ABC transporter B member 11 [Gonapodya sp. JEL0774]|nr:ABC transporter B member 11 [Gonapodya sp. JEL0774]
MAKAKPSLLSSTRDDAQSRLSILFISALVTAGLGMLAGCLSLGLFRWIGESAEKGFRFAYFRALLRQDLAWHELDAASPIEMVTSLRNDPLLLSFLLSTTLPNLLTAFSSTAVSTVLLFVRAPFPGLVTVCAVVLFGVVLEAVGRWAARVGREAVRRQEGQGRVVASAVVNIKEAILHTSLPHISHLFHLYALASQSLGERAAHAHALSLSLAGAFMIFLVAIIVVTGAVGAGGGWGKLLSAGDVVAAVVLGVVGVVAIGGVRGKWEEVAAGRGAGGVGWAVMRRVPMELSGVPRSSRSTAVAAAATSSAFEPLTASSHSPPASPPRSFQTTSNTPPRVTCRSLRFSPPTQPDNVALSSFSLDVPSGSLLAIVGAPPDFPLAALLSRLYEPDDGVLELDGRDVRGVPVDMLRRSLVHVVEKTTTIWGGNTVGENVAVGHPGGPNMCSEADIAMACEMVGVDSAIHGWAEGYAKIVGEGGMWIGEEVRQRIGMARAVCGGRGGVVIIDHATDGMDESLEKALVHAIARAGTAAYGSAAASLTAKYPTAVVPRPRTTILITNRISALLPTDLVAVVREGKVVDYGTLEYLSGPRGTAFKDWVTAASHTSSTLTELSLAVAFADSTPTSFLRPSDAGEHTVSVAHTGRRRRRPRTADQMRTQSLKALSQRVHAGSRRYVADLRNRERLAAFAGPQAPGLSDPTVSGSAFSGRLSMSVSGMSISTLATTMTDGTAPPVTVAPHVFSTWDLFLMNKPEWPLIAIGSLFAAIRGAVLPCFAVTLAMALTSVAENPADPVGSVGVWIMVLLVLACAEGLVFYLKVMVLEVTGERLTMRVRRQLFDAILGKSLQWFAQPDHSADVVLARMATDAPRIRGATTSNLGNLINFVVGFAIGAVWAIATGWRLALVGLSFVPIILLAAQMESASIIASEQRLAKSLSEGDRIALEAVGNIESIKCMALEAWFADKYRVNWEANRRGQTGIGTLLTAGFALSQLAVFLCQTILLYYGGRLVVSDEYRVYQVFIVWALMVFCCVTAGQIVGLSDVVAKARESATLISELITSYDERSRMTGTYRGDGRGPIEFRVVSVVHPPLRDRALSGLTVTIAANQNVALMGVQPNSGHLAFVDVLMKLYDATKGNIYFDGVDVSSWDTYTLRNRIAVLNANGPLDNSTILENIFYGSRTTSVADAIAASKEAGLHSILTKRHISYGTACYDPYHPENMNSLITDDIRRHILLARLLLRKPRVLIVNELADMGSDGADRARSISTYVPSSAAALRSSELIFVETLARVAQGRTFIWLPRYLSDIPVFESAATSTEPSKIRVLVMKEGDLIYEGTADDLLSRTAAR